MLGRITTESGVGLDLADTQARVGFVADQYRTGIVSGLTVSVADALIVAPGEFVLWGNRARFPYQVTLAPLSTSDHVGHVVIEASTATQYASDSYGRTQETRTDVRYAHNVVATVDPTKHLLLATYCFVTKPKLDASGEPMYLDVPYSKAAVPVNYMYLSKMRGLKNIVVTQGSVPCVFSNSPVEHGTYWVDAEAGIFRFAAVDSALTFVLEFTAEEPVTYQDRYIASVGEDIATFEDLRHNTPQVRSTARNPHGTGFNDVAGSVPLHRLVSDTGFHVYDPSNRAGVPGTIVTQDFLATEYVNVDSQTVHGFQVDMFGEDTGVLGDQFIELPFPLRVLSVVDDSNRNVRYRMYNNRICFDADQGFTRADGTAMTVTITYSVIPDFTPASSIGNRVALAPNQSAQVFSEGLELPLSDTSVEVGFAKYTGLPCDVRVALDSKSAPIISPAFVDSGLVSNQQSRFSSAVSLPYASTVSVTCVGSKLRNPLLPPMGHLTVNTDASEIFGRWRLVYKYFRPQRLRLAKSVTTTLPDYAGNNAGAFIVRDPELTLNGNVIAGYTNGSLLDHDSWRVPVGSAGVVLAGDVYLAYPNSKFLQVVPEAMSARNTSGPVEVTGTAATPAGSAATASLVSTGAAWNTGDYVQIALPDGSNVTRTYFRTAQGFTGATTDAIAQGMADAVQANPLALASGISASVSGSQVRITAASGSAWTAVGVTAWSSNSSLKVVVESAPSDVAYAAVVTVLSSDLGDAWISFVPDQSSGTITIRNYAQGFTGDALPSLMASLAADPTLSGLGYVPSMPSNLKLVITAPAGTDGNSAKLTATTANAAVTCTTFSGGSDGTTTDVTLLDGLVVTISDGYTYDPDGRFVVYATNELDSGNSESRYYKVGEVAQVQGSNQVQLTLSKASWESTNLVSYGVESTLDLTTEFNLVLQISGTDSSGAALTETLTVTPQNFAEFTERRLGQPNALQFVRTTNTFQSISSWVVISSNAVGDCTLFVVADNVAGVRGLFPVFSGFWDGAGLRGIRDQRVLVPCIAPDDNAQLRGESLETVNNMLHLISNLATL